MIEKNVPLNTWYSIPNTMDKRYWKKKGPSYKDRIRCPLCGKISPLINFSMDHLFGVFRYWFKGRGNISCEMLKKDSSFMTTLYEDFAKRLLELLERFTGMCWYSQLEIDDLVADHERKIAMQTLTHIPHGVISSVASPHLTAKGIRAYKVVIE